MSLPLSIFLAVFVWAALAAGPAAAQKRVALVIGNDAYKSEAVLKNAINDARLVAGALSQAKFQVIEVKPDLGIADFRQALRGFQVQADGAEVALIYYAGHGMEANGANWLIPTDAVLAEVRDLDYEAINIDLALKALSGAHLRILVLDACRNNPFGRSWRRGSRDLVRGLRAVDTDDVLVLFAAAPGQTASDGCSSNSPFATAFARRVPEPGLAVQLLGGRVRDDVLGATGGGRRPYVSASITGEPFYLVPAAVASGSDPQGLTPATPQQQSAAAEAWPHVRDSTSISDLEAYLLRFRDTFYGDLAQGRLVELKRAGEEQRVAALEKHKPQVEDAVSKGERVNLASSAKKSEQAKAETTSKAAVPRKMAKAEDASAARKSVDVDHSSSRSLVDIQRCRNLARNWWSLSTGYGAIAVGAADCGVSWHHRTEEGARKRAVVECQKRTTNCRVIEAKNN